MGKEGPMIHSGAVVGAGLPQVRVAKPGDEPSEFTQQIWKHPLGMSLMQFQNLLPLGVEVKVVWSVPAKHVTIAPQSIAVLLSLGSKNRKQRKS